MLEKCVETLENRESLLTYPALTGQHKQSVRDAERLLSKEMVEFMKRKGYSFEAKYIETILNWRRYSDERGLTQLLCCRYNYDMLNYLLYELMPWYKENYDFSTLEVNGYVITCGVNYIHMYPCRSLKGIRGLSRETLVALTTTIKSREWMRRRRVSEGLQPEQMMSSAFLVFSETQLALTSHPSL